MAELKKEDLDAMIKEAVGKVAAEIRAESEAKAKEEKAEKPRTYVNPFSDVDSSEIPDRQKGLRAARFLRYLAAGKGDPERGASIAEKRGDKYMAKALNESVFEAGGALVPEDFMGEITELLRAQSVVRAAGAGSVPMPRGSITMPYQSAASTAAYIGELANVNPSQPEFGQLVLTAKKLSCLVPISNDLLRDASPQVDAFVRDDMVKSMALREDLAFIRGDGSSNTPKGLRYLAKAGNVFGQSGATATDVSNDLHKAVLKLEENNISMGKLVWLMSPRTKSGISKVRDSGDNGYLFRDEMAGGTLLGFPFKVTTQIPNNLSGSESELYLADFSSLVIGESMQMEVSVFEGGAYHDGSAVVSGISTDQTILRALARHDFGARQRGAEIAVITGVTWGS